MPSRRIVRDVNEAARDIARRKMQTKAFLKSRDQKKRVEMRFAHLKTHHGFERMRLRGLSGARDEFHLAAIVQTSRGACSDHRLNWRKRELGRQYHLSTRTQQLSSKTTAKQVIGLTNPANLANHRVFRQHRPGPDSDSHWPEAGRVVK